MGAQEFTNRGTGKTAAEAFSRVVDEARYEHGHGGYSGTIAEKTEFVMVPGVHSRDKANAKAQALLDADDRRYSDKWGAAGCIELDEKLPKGEKAFLFFGLASS